METEYIEKLKNKIISFGYSKKTIDTYLVGFKAFCKFIDKPLHYAKNEDFENFKIYLIKNKKEPKTINAYVMAVKFFYKNILNRNIKCIKGVKQKNKLPVVHDKEFIYKMISSTINIKHRLLIMLLYSSGLRVSEAVKLKVNDLDLNKKLCFVREGKGNKDRITILSDNFVSLVKKYIDEINNSWDYVNQENRYLFPGRQSHLNVRTAQEIVLKAGKRIDKTKKVFPHSLRSSFATHLLEHGVDISKIGKLLGHKSTDTTKVYTKISTIEFIAVNWNS